MISINGYKQNIFTFQIEVYFLESLQYFITFSLLLDNNIASFSSFGIQCNFFELDQFSNPVSYTHAIKATNQLCDFDIYQLRIYNHIFLKDLISNLWQVCKKIVLYTFIDQKLNYIPCNSGNLSIWIRA